MATEASNIVDYCSFDSALHTGETVEIGQFLIKRTCSKIQLGISGLIHLGLRGIISAVVYPPPIVRRGTPDCQLIENVVN